MDWVKTTDLTSWADSRDCQSTLPALVRRLIRATAQGIKTMTFPAGENVQMGGWDGYLEVVQDTEFVPDGVSVWEFGTSKSPQTKADSDYTKRTENPVGVDPKQATFVFVTPRRWKKSEEWIQQKKEEGHWKDVKVITAVKLEEWIENAPSVGFWLATTHLEKYPSEHIQTAEKFWEEWSINGEKLLLPSLILSGREKSQATLIEKCTGHIWIGVKSISKEESLAFIIASFMADEAHSDNFFSRCLIVSNEETFRMLESKQSPLILIPRFINTGLFRSAVSRGHSVLVPLGTEDDAIQEASISLDEINRDGFIASLRESGYKEADQLSRDTARNIAVLRRRLGFDGTKPQWAETSENVRVIIPAIIAGRWHETDGDKDIVSGVAGMVAYDDYIAALSPWLVSSDPPILRINDYWRLTSPYDAFSYSYRYWTAQNFKRLENAVVKVFSETDESIKKKETSNDLFTQFKNQSTNRYSDALREGLLMTLILVATHDQPNPNKNHPQEWVDGIIWQILSNGDLYFWKTISIHLPLIAEASPESLLARVERMQEDSSQTLTQALFSKPSGYDPFYHKNYSLGMLSALESLAWEPRFLARASNILLTLSKIPIPSNIGNNPKNSLKEIFQPWHCQTFATYKDQKEILQLLLKQKSDLAWQLLLKIMPDPHGGISFQTHRMRWRSFGKLRDTYYRNEVNDMWNFVFDLLLTNTENRIERYSDLIRISDNIGEHNRAKLFEKIRQARVQINDADAVLWNQLRQFLHHHQEFPDADWALKETSLKPYLECYDYFTPKDVILKNLWVFDEHRIEMINPEPITERHNRWYEKSLEFRKTCLKDIYNQLGIEVVLECINRVKIPSLLGDTLVHLISDEEIVDTVEYSTEHQLPSEFIRSLFYKLSWIKSDDEMFFILNSLNLNELPLEIAGNILTVTKQTKEIWAYISTLDKELVDYYWTNVQLTNWNGLDEEIEFGAQKLFEYKRYSSAVDYLYMNLMNNRELPTKTLADCMLGLVHENKDKFPPKSWDLNKLLIELDKRDDVDNEQMTMIELFTVLLYRDGDYTPKRVYKALSENVENCIELIRWEWVRDDIIDDQDNSIASFKFKIAWEILDKFNMIPGMREDGTIDGAVLNSWVNTLRNAATETGLLKYADALIGDLLATYPRTSEGYPPVEICEIIEKLQSKDINVQYEVKIHNSRGVTVRDPFDGGGLERGEASYYQGIAEKHRHTHPTVCRIFERIANSLLRYGEYNDYQAKMDLLEC
ncbi:MAG: hypothetical protein LBM07_01960 [Culturomica sp.]|nr:hypothetical protein [Culturomica sp.]